jgi:hypothetical protein
VKWKLGFNLIDVMAMCPVIGITLRSLFKVGDIITIQEIGHTVA